MILTEEQKQAIIEYAELRYDLGYKEGFTAGFITMGFLIGFAGVVVIAATK